MLPLPVEATGEENTRSPEMIFFFKWFHASRHIITQTAKKR